MSLALGAFVRSQRCLGPSRAHSRRLFSRTSWYSWPNSANLTYLTSIPCTHTSCIPLLGQRGYKNLASNTPPTVDIVKPPVKKQIPDLVGEVADVSQAEQRRSDWSIIKKLMLHVWPKGDIRTRGTVLFGFGLLVGGKVRGQCLVRRDMFT